MNLYVHKLYESSSRFLRQGKMVEKGPFFSELSDRKKRKGNGMTILGMGGRKPLRDVFFLPENWNRFV